MIHTILKGWVLGLTIAVLIGPAFFTLLQTSIYRGFKSGFFLAIGICISDTNLVLLSYFGASQIVYEPALQKIISIIGGGILIVFGIVTFTRKVHIQTENDSIQIKIPGPFANIVKGYLLNFVNPTLWIFWLGVVAAVTSSYSTPKGQDIKSILLFFVACLGTILVTDIIKCFIANKIKQYLNNKFMAWLNRIVGLSLIGIGLLLMLKVLI